jgi:hypothetical protein
MSASEILNFGGGEIATRGVPGVDGGLSGADIMIEMMSFDGSAGIVAAALAEGARSNDIDAMAGRQDRWVDGDGRIRRH